MKKLDDTGKENPFRIPEDYFTVVNRRIILAAEESAPGERDKGLYARLRPLLKVAAFISGFIAISYIILKSFLPAEQGVTVAGVSPGDFSESYMNEIELSIIEEESAALVLSEDVPDVSSSDIIDQLLMENVNLEEIYEQL